MGRAIRSKLEPGETCFGGGSGILIPFNPNRMRSSKLPSTPPGSEADNPMLGAMNALEDALEEAYRQNMARLGLEPYEESQSTTGKPDNKN